MEDLWHRRRLNLSGRYSAHNLSNNVVLRITSYFTKWKGNFKLGHGLKSVLIGGIAGQQCCTDGGAVEAEFGGNDFGCFKTGLECSAFCFLNYWIED